MSPVRGVSTPSAAPVQRRIPASLIVIIFSHTRRSNMPEKTGEITVLLRQWRDGDRSAENELFTLVLPHLRRLAHYLMKGERKGHSLEPTELIDQAYLRMISAKERDWRNRQHFFAIAARAMRRQLIDHARGRPSADFVPLEGLENLLPGDSAKIETGIVVDRLLDGLEIGRASC